MLYFCFYSLDLNTFPREVDSRRYRPNFLKLIKKIQNFETSCPYLESALHIDHYEYKQAYIVG